MKNPLSKEQAVSLLIEISDHLKDAYQSLCGYDEWREIEADLPMKAALIEARHKSVDGFSIVELARRRLEEIIKKEETERSNTQ